MNVLIIDDDPDDTALFCEALTASFPDAKCYTINACKNIRQTLEEVHADIIFMDGHMHPVSGKECLKLLHEHIDRQKVTIIIHSGSLSPVELSEFMALGVDDIILKAIDFQEWKSNIARTVDKYCPKEH